MNKEELNKLIELASKLQKEPDIEMFDEDDYIYEFIRVVELYKDYLGFRGEE